MFLFILVFVLTSVTQAVAQTELVPVPEPISNTQAIQDVPNNIEKSALPAATAEMEALRELDQTAPTIETVMVASSNTASPPIVSAVLTDDRSGVSLVEIHWRQKNSEVWKTTPLTANHNGLFMAMLPRELAVTGFDYFVVAFDAAGNGPAQYASQTKPKIITASKENTRQRIQRVEGSSNAEGGVSSGWLMVNVMLCILTSGTSILFWADYMDIEDRKAQVTNDETLLRELNNAQVNDAFIGSVSALAGIVTLSTTGYLLTQPIKE